MSVFLALLGKELRAVFFSPIAYVVIVVYLLLTGYSFIATLFVARTATLTHIFFQSAALMLLIVPLTTMRLVAEERRSGTLELMLTAPIRESHLVLSKYLAAMLMVVCMIALTAPCAVVLGVFGSPDWGPIYGGYLGLALLASSLVALGLLCSALTANQVVAAMLTIAAAFLAWMIDTLAALAPEALERALIGISLLAHFTPFATGAMYLSDFGFFVIATLLALLLAVRALGRK